MYRFLYWITIKNWMTVLPVIVVAIILYSYVIHRSKTGEKYKWGKQIVFFLYLYLLYSITVGSRNTWDARESELRLFWTYREVILWHKTNYLFENFANVMMFLPLGIYLESVQWMRGKVCRAAAIGFCFSLSIEIVQKITSRGCFDVDDLFHNTLGAVLGFVIMRKLMYGTKADVKQ